MKFIKIFFLRISLFLIKVFPPELSSYISLNALTFFSYFSRNTNVFNVKNYHKKPIIIGDLSFSNYLGLAAGLDKEGKYFSTLSNLGFGFIEVGTFTPIAQKGNPKPRVKRLTKDESLINSLGFNNPGIINGMKNINRNKKNFTGILGISIGKNKDTSLDDAYKDYRFCLRECFELADYVAVNISSPNTVGLRELSSASFLEDLIDEINLEKIKLEKQFSKHVPIFFKLSPDEEDNNLKNIINLSLSKGISGFIISNTSKAKVNGLEGGISGKLLKTQSLEMLKKVKKMKNKKCTLISSGGISTKHDVEERLNNGADLVQIYTSFVYKGPEIVNDLLN